MPFELAPQAPRRIAVIGGGISGMGAAHALSRHHHVVLYETGTRLGGHARTVLAGKRGDQPVDTGFIVFNRVNYPHLARLFDDLEVPVVRSDMSFGASVRGGWLEYGLRDLTALSAQKRNLARPEFWAMLRDVARFNAQAPAACAGRDLTIGDLIETLRLGPWFRDYYLTPLSGAIWSTPTARILDFPAEPLIRFFQNHNLMQVSGQHQWWTVQGGSVQYVRRLRAALDRRGVDIRLGAEATEVTRPGPLVRVKVKGAEVEGFDAVVMACHSDQALALLGDAAPGERQPLSAIRYQPNRAILHADPSVMPQRRKVWSSWNYRDHAGAEDRIALTYWMNALQPIPKDDPLFVTLNPGAAIREELIQDEVTFAHPLYDTAALDAQTAIRAQNGTRNTWFAGAWMRNGFHEDGLASGLEVAEAILAQPVLMAAE